MNSPFPCATQNELSGDDARTLIDQGVIAVSEGANMPTELDGVHAFRDAGVLFAPAKAANAGGVAVSGLEQSQNALRISWSRDEVDERLRTIMSDIHGKCVQYGTEYGRRTTRSTTSPARTSAGSSRSPTRCSPTAPCSGVGLTHPLRSEVGARDVR